MFYRVECCAYGRTPPVKLWATSLFVLLLLVSGPAFAGECTHYAGPGSATPTVASFWDVAVPGATLCLRSGFYAPRCSW